VKREGGFRKVWIKIVVLLDDEVRSRSVGEDMSVRGEAIYKASVDEDAVRIAFSFTLNASHELLVFRRAKPAGSFLARMRGLPQSLSVL
jgi:hypothetical protein